MGKTLPRPLSSPRRPKVTAARVEARQSEEIDLPYAQCMCDLETSYGGTPLPPEWSARLYNSNVETTGHLPHCPQLRTVPSKMSRKHNNSDRPASYLDIEEEAGKLKADTRKKDARRQRKEAKRIRDAEARAEAMRSVKLPHDPYDEAHSDSEEDFYRQAARTIRRTHSDGTVAVHLPNCLTSRSDYITPRRPHLAPPKSPSYVDFEDKEIRTEIWKKTKHPRRQPPKSAAYVDLEEDEEEGGGHGRASPPVIRYDCRTIASDFLRVIGKHPYLPPLNAHVEGFPTKKKGRA
ncbi:hypothetical protein IMSHALPRED_005172 [Imshaugia aleurites]|uniref:Uncharacterized protein n=1 Tax=Imshaugia aleurites TaxID=172621 RepID=A0A8H3F8J1_9LECA|nr:hypothetical protein IMSHALPRED_005172 [Imshaugia aleurites]